MIPSAAYSEDALVEQPAIALFADLGWQTVNAYHETLVPKLISGEVDVADLDIMMRTGESA